ncbi:MAG: TetR family transcriptional regulator [Actinomycetota bacterium]
MVVVSIAVLSPKQSERRGRLIKAAIALASTGGYDAVQMRDVAAKAKVALGTLYRYFPSKDDLLVAAMGEWIEELRDRLTTRPPRGQSEADRVVDVLRRATRAMEAEPVLSSALVTAVTNLSSEDQKAMEDANALYLVMGEIMRGVMDHDFEAADRIAHALSQVWFAAVIGWVRGWAQSGQMFKDLESAARLML